METLQSGLPETITQVVQDINGSVAENRWSVGARIAFRFVCSYFLLYCFPQPLDYVVSYLSQWAPWIGALDERLFGWADTIWNAPTLWLAAHVFHAAPSIVENGSGDRTFDWIQAALFLMLAVAATVVWSILDRKNRYDERIYPWFRLYIRIVLAMIILSYGAAKIFPSQFYAIPLSRYMQPLTAGSPMGLLWSMMSASRTYTVFAGSVETLAAVLLFVPRFATLGALLAASSMANVFMLNLGYDVPVKQLSFHLLLMSVIVAGPDLRGLASLFLLQRPARLFVCKPPFARAWLNRAGLIAQLVCCAVFVPAALVSSQAEAADRAATPPYYGLWRVERFALQGRVRAPLTTDAVRWREVGFDHFRRFWIEPMDGLPVEYHMAFDSAQDTLNLRDIGWESGASENSPAGGTVGTFAIRQTSRGRLELDGVLRGKRIEVTLARVPLKSFLLNSRGFHWVNDSPQNR